MAELTEREEHIAELAWQTGRDYERHLLETLAGEATAHTAPHRLRPTPSWVYEAAIEAETAPRPGDHPGGPVAPW